jgi:hypothetical protein
MEFNIYWVGKRTQCQLLYGKFYDVHTCQPEKELLLICRAEKEYNENILKVAPVYLSKFSILEQIAYYTKVPLEFKQAKNKIISRFIDVCLGIAALNLSSFVVVFITNHLEFDWLTDYEKVRIYERVMKVKYTKETPRKIE